MLFLTALVPSVCPACRGLPVGICTELHIRVKAQRFGLPLGPLGHNHSSVSLSGWSGSGGLGVKEQGIQDPIKGGDVRDKWDQYKGVGVALDDPYENYRRNKSYSFIARMKAREECK